MADFRTFTRVRNGVVDDALYDYVTIIRVTSWARELIGEDEPPAALQGAVADLLVSLLGHDLVAVVTGQMDYEYVAAAQVRAAVAAGWRARPEELPIPGEVAWVVRRNGSVRAPPLPLT